MSRMDLAATCIVTTISREHAATVHTDVIEFDSPVFVGDEVSLFARMVSRAEPQ
jgi:acyl-CoA thioesterase YciA